MRRYRRLTHTALAIMLIGLAISACDDDPATTTAIPSPAAATPTGDSTAAATRTAAPPTATTAGAATSVATPRPSPSPTAAATVARVDGTVAPQGFGGTEPVTIKSNPDPFAGNATLRAVRLGVHPEEGGWDRIVLEFDGNLPPGVVEYVPSATTCGRGDAVTVRGNAMLVARFTQSVAHTDAGQPTVVNRALTGAGPALLEARQICDFEGHVEWAIGVANRNRFKVTLLSAPRRVVIDIKQ